MQNDIIDLDQAFATLEETVVAAAAAHVYSQEPLAGQEPPTRLDLVWAIAPEIDPRIRGAFLRACGATH